MSPTPPLARPLLRPLPPSLAAASLETSPAAPVAATGPHARRLPGVLLALALAGIALAAAELPFFASRGLGALTLAIVLGMVLGNSAYAHVAPACAPGIDWTRHWLLRAGIVLYGLRLTLQDVSQVGVAGVLIDVTVIGSTFALAVTLGRRWLGLDRETSVLIGIGSAICGAAAVLGAQPVVRARADQVATAISTVVVFGTLSMFLYPHLLAPWQAWMGGTADFGVYVGSTVHEVAQVVAAAEAAGPQMIDSAVIAKMVRVMMLAPFLVLLSLAFARPAPARRAGRGIVVPWFAFGFIAVVAAHSVVRLPPTLHATLVQLDNLLLAAAMAALGLTTQISAIRRAGLRPLLLAAVLCVWLVVGGVGINVAGHWLFGAAGA